MKIFLIAMILAVSGCGTEERQSNPVVLTEEEPKKTSTICWDEYQCFDVWVETRRGRCLKKACSKVRICEETENSTENMRRKR